MAKTKLRSFALALLSCVMVFALCLGIGLAPKKALAVGGSDGKYTELTFTTDAGTTTTEGDYLTNTTLKWTHLSSGGSTSSPTVNRVYNYLFRDNSEDQDFKTEGSGASLKMAANKGFDIIIPKAYTDLYCTGEYKEFTAKLTIYAPQDQTSRYIQLYNGDAFTEKTITALSGGDSMEFTIKDISNNICTSSVTDNADTSKNYEGYYYLRFKRDNGSDFKIDYMTLELPVPVKTVAENFTVTFNADGGQFAEGGETKTETITYQSGEERNKTVAKPQDPTKANFKFDYWMNEATNEEYDFNSYVTSDLNLKAVWIEAGKKVVTAVDGVSPTEENVYVAKSIVVANGVDVKSLMPKTLKLTAEGASVDLAVSWEEVNENLFDQKQVLTASLVDVENYIIDHNITIVVEVTIKNTTAVQGNKVLAHWDAREQTKQITEYDTDEEGNFIVAEKNGVKVVAQSTVVNGATSAGGNAISIIAPNDNKNPQRPSAWIRIDLPYSAIIKIRAGADGSGNREFNITQSATSHENPIDNWSHSVGGKDIFGDEKYLHATQLLEAGSYYLWDVESKGNSAQVYEIIVEDPSIQVNYTTYKYAEGETLLEAEALPVQSDYQFVGWVNPNGAVETAGEPASKAGGYAPLYVKFSMTGTVKQEGDGGIKYEFTVELINGDALDLTNVSIKLTLKATREVTKDGGASYADGKMVSSAVVTGWSQDTASKWRDIQVSAKIAVDFGTGEFTYTGKSMSAKDIAQKVVEAHPELKEKLAIYLGE